MIIKDKNLYEIEILLIVVININKIKYYNSLKNYVSIT